MEASLREKAKKIAVILPGIGYTCDRSLLYYGGRLALSLGFEVVRVPYGGFPDKVRGDADRMRLCVDIALRQAVEMLKNIDWNQYGQILFIAKSVGTVVAAAYAHAHGLSCRFLLFTPVEATFAAPVKNAVAFHGTADPWAETEALARLCREANVPLYITDNANHSLETGDVLLDVRSLETVMKQAEAFMRGEE